MDSFKVNLHQNQGMLTGIKARENVQNTKRKRSEIEESEVRTKPSTREPSPLKMENIVEKVLGFLDVESIKTARQVSKLWSVEGAKLLLTKCFVKIPSGFRNGESSANRKLMRMFKAFLSYKSRDVSMIPNIIIEAVADFKLWKSLGILGPQVNAVTLTKIGDKREILKKLLVLLPNIKYLILNDGPEWFEGFNIVEVLTSSLVSKSENNRKPIIISGMSLRPDNLDEFEQLEDFSDCSNAKFKDFRLAVRPSLLSEIPQHEAQMATILKKLLSTSQSTLERLDLCYCETFLSLVQFPCLPALNILSLYFQQSTPITLPQCKFSPCFRFAEKFPNLDHVCIDCSSVSSGSHFLRNLLENTGTTPSVKVLTFTASSEVFSVNWLFKIFPNIKRFEIEPSRYTKEVFHSVYKHGKSIKGLSIAVNLDHSIGEVANLDSILTGFSPATVDWIKKIPKWIDCTINNVEQLRVNPSILDFKGLNYLEIHFDGTSLNLLPERTLDVAAEYALKKMPKDIKVYINVEDNVASEITYARTSLDKVCKLPNVKFVQKTD